jgi:hypothetical protein
LHAPCHQRPDPALGEKTCLVRLAHSAFCAQDFAQSPRASMGQHLTVSQFRALCLVCCPPVASGAAGQLKAPVSPACPSVVQPPKNRTAGDGQIIARGRLVKQNPAGCHRKREKPRGSTSPPRGRSLSRPPSRSRRPRGPPLPPAVAEQAEGTDAEQGQRGRLGDAGGAEWRRGEPAGQDAAEKLRAGGSAPGRSSTSPLRQSQEMFPGRRRNERVPNRPTATCPSSPASPRCRTPASRPRLPPRLSP